MKRLWFITNPHSGSSDTAKAEAILATFAARGLTLVGRTNFPDDDLPTPGALETYKGGRWADTPPLVLRGLLIEAFQQTGRIAGVGAVTSGLHADYTMTIDLYDFEVQYRDGAPHAVIRLNAKLNDASINRVRAAKTFEADEAVSGATAGEAAAAFDRTIDALLADIVRWTIDQGEAAWSQTQHPSRSPP